MHSKLVREQPDRSNHCNPQTKYSTVLLSETRNEERSAIANLRKLELVWNVFGYKERGKKSINERVQFYNKNGRENTRTYTLREKEQRNNEVQRISEVKRHLMFWLIQKSKTHSTCWRSILVLTMAIIKKATTRTIKAAPASQRAAGVNRNLFT